MKKFAWLFLVFIVLTSMFVPQSKAVATDSIKYSQVGDRVDNGPILPPEYS